MMETTEFRLYMGEIVDLLREIKTLLEESRDARMVLEQSTKLPSQEDGGSIPSLGVNKTAQEIK
jgi:hypothetical protein